jgi:hypothetical protein
MELTQSQQTYQQAPGYFKRLTLLDWLFGLALLAGAVFALNRYGHFMDVYEQGILLAAVPTFAALGWHWKPVRWLMPLVACCRCGPSPCTPATRQRQQEILAAHDAVQPVGDPVDERDVRDLHRVLLDRLRRPFAVGIEHRLQAVLGRRGAGLDRDDGALVRVLPDRRRRGPYPVSNLYEVFILFSLITAMFYLYFEQRYATRQMGPFVLLVISAAIGFLMWYTTSRDAADIQPLLPALQSWWMKIHVPANFIGYGNFALAAMVASPTC